MKNLLLRKLLLLFFIAAVQSSAFAQEDPEDIGQSEEVEIASTTLSFSEADQGQPVEDIKEEDLDIRARPATSRNGTLEAPPDCPECTPDPGGDVEDVPFDRRLLVILLAGAVYVYIKASKKKNKADTHLQKQEHEIPVTVFEPALG